MILDTDVLSRMASGRASGHIADELSRLTGAVHTTSINWAEVCYGVARSPRGQWLRRAYEELVLPAVVILGFDRESAEIYGQLCADLESSGTRLDEADLMIAAIALRNDLPIATGNIRHFERVPGLRVEDWLA